MFANTGGKTGPAAGRDLYVLNFLAEVGGVGVERMVRLEGGLNGWRNAGFEVGPPPKPPPAASLGALLEEAGLTHLSEPLATRSLEGLAATFADGGRTKLLDELKEIGLGLKDRQGVANAVSRAVKLMKT